MNYFYAVGISISLAITSEIFIEIGYFFSVLWKKTKVDVFFSEHTVQDRTTSIHSRRLTFMSMSAMST